VRTPAFFIIAIVLGTAVLAASRLLDNAYVFFAGYVVLQYIVLATAWNILGGYCGYVNFGTAAFFALGAYSSVAVQKLLPMPVPVLIAIGAVISGIVGLGTGYLTLRLRGAFFSIATLALAVVVQTLITNWDFVGGSRGAYILRPAQAPLLGSYIQYLFMVMMVLAIVAITAARAIERSWLGYGFASIRDDELAAEAAGVPTLRLKLVATTLSGAFMGMAGAPLPYYVTYLDPSSGFNLAYAVNSIAMPLIGGTNSWVGPVIGAILLGTIQQVATVSISSAINLLIVGLLIVDCVIIAPNGITGLVRERRASPDLVAHPAVFALLYVLNTIPIYFLQQQGRSIMLISLELIFWFILVFLAWMRGRVIGRNWLVAIPAVGAGMSVFPGPGWLLLIATILNIVCIACGLSFRPDRVGQTPSKELSRANSIW
jgi:branched-chain amino acid transport system permease protein